ncbi:helix-turn-helix transcriptional regulator [Nocardiopsis metallicus]|uniref:Transcriptional regulator with XRE-family HTH domain n=1 Tax=Nocardiopsis metallicus TaxID=179819 RepID=A0A840W4R1_9ACTN|nr:helix-turn-helix transcriptional regulator [Nocardiopsis metallicus]MBB5491950.1 transcriptional regulator with XRE-family HTH domain [Nocardiopsis metallicus]
MASRREALARQRKTAGHTQESLAALLKVDRSTVARWESGATTPHPGQRPEIAEALQITRAQLELLLNERLRTPNRRTVLAGGGALAAGALVLPVIGAHDLRRILDTIQDARQRLDDEAIEHFERAMRQSATDDGLYGPGAALPGLLGVLAAITEAARQARSAQRGPLLRLGVRGAELAAWFYRDLGQPAAADQWRDQAITWARCVDEPALEAYVLLRRAQAAWDTRDGATMIQLSTAVLSNRWNLPSHVRAEALQQQARGRAMVGEPIGAIARSLDRAASLLAAGDGAGSLSQHYGRSLFALQAALCHAEAGRVAHAVELYETHLHPDLFSHRDHVYFSSLQALSLADTGYPEKACETALAALPVAQEVGSQRTLGELARLPGRLRPWHRRPVVRETVRELTLAAG